VIEIIVNELEKAGIDFAFIGGIAVAAAGFPRFTEDIDILINSKDFEKTHTIMLRLDYKPFQTTEEFALYESALKYFGNIDFMLAHRQYSINMLQRAKYKDFYGGKLKVKVIDPEDVIGLKLQAFVNNPKRNQDLVDIENVIKINKTTLDMGRIKEYFSIFNKDALLDEILRRISND
jgi:hypothetical protein